MNFYDNKYISEFCEDTLELKILQLRKIKEKFVGEYKYFIKLEQDFERIVSIKDINTLDLVLNQINQEIVLLPELKLLVENNLIVPVNSDTKTFRNFKAKLTGIKENLRHNNIAISLKKAEDEITFYKRILISQEQLSIKEKEADIAKAQETISLQIKAEQDAKAEEAELEKQRLKTQESENLRISKEKEADIAKAQETISLQIKAEQDAKAKEAELEKQRLKTQESENLRISKEKEADIAKAQEAKSLQIKAELEAKVKEVELEKQRLKTQESENLRISKDKEADIAKAQEAKSLQIKAEQDAKTKEAELEKQRLKTQEAESLRIAKEKEAEIARTQEAKSLQIKAEQEAKTKVAELEKQRLKTQEAENLRITKEKDEALISLNNTKKELEIKKLNIALKSKAIYKYKDNLPWIKIYNDANEEKEDQYNRNSIKNVIRNQLSLITSYYYTFKSPLLYHNLSYNPFGYLCSTWQNKFNNENRIYSSDERTFHNILYETIYLNIIKSIPVYLHDFFKEPRPDVITDDLINTIANNLAKPISIVIDNDILDLNFILLIPTFQVDLVNLNLKKISDEKLDYNELFSVHRTFDRAAFDSNIILKLLFLDNSFSVHFRHNSGSLPYFHSRTHQVDGKIKTSISYDKNAVASGYQHFTPLIKQINLFDVDLQTSGYNTVNFIKKV